MFLRFKKYYLKALEKDSISINLYTKWSKEKSYVNDYSFFEIVVTEYDSDLAFEKAYQIVQLAVSLINCGNSWTTFSLLGSLHGLSEILSPPGVFCFSKGDEYLYFLGFRDFPHEVIKFNNSKFKRFKWFHDRITQLPSDNPIRKKLPDILLLYHLALIDQDPSIAFLKFWMGLEKMTLMHQGDREEKVVKRIKSIIKFPYAFYETKLDTLFTKRNKLVHEGAFELVSPNDVNLVKMIYEKLFIFLLHQCKLKRTLNELDIIYELRGRAIKEINEYKKMSGYLLKHRPR